MIVGPLEIEKAECAQPKKSQIAQGKTNPKSAFVRKNHVIVPFLDAEWTGLDILPPVFPIGEPGPAFCGYVPRFIQERTGGAYFPLHTVSIEPPQYFTRGQFYQLYFLTFLVTC